VAPRLLGLTGARGEFHWAARTGQRRRPAAWPACAGDESPAGRHL